MNSRSPQDGSKKKRFRNRKSDCADELKLLEDKDGDGKYESARVLTGDLETPSSMLLHDGWLYLSGAARRRPATCPAIRLAARGSVRLLRFQSASGFRADDRPRWLAVYHQWRRR